MISPLHNPQLPRGKRPCADTNRLRTFGFALLAFLLGSLSFASGLSAQAANEAYYRKHIKPLLSHKCYACHGALRQQGGLRLDTVKAMLKGGDSGPALTPNAPEDSLLLGVVTGEAGFRMPPDNEGAALTVEEISQIRRWIANGANAPKNETPQSDAATWWSYQPIRRPDLPLAKEPTWCRTPVDYFIAAAREDRELPHAREASKPRWLRRVFLDLTGLPPTPEQLEQFLADHSPTAYERVVDELLASPAYGERWGRHWMDIWRYSDWYGSRGGNEIRYSQRHIWRWRDWMVARLNQGVGYDEMIRQMLAADELSTGDTSNLPATGYLGRNWYKFDRDVWLFDTVERTSEALLAVTMRCCRCHDHKFDPITHEEYYRFRAYFEPHNVRTDPLELGGPTEKDAKLGDVLQDGLPLVFDQNPDAKTYRFERGDNRYPDKSKELQPGVPARLQLDHQAAAPVATQLAAEVWYPAMRPTLRASLEKHAAQLVSAAKANLEQQQTKLQTAAGAVEQWDRDHSQDVRLAQKPASFVEDGFDASRPDLWQPINGNWKHVDGKLVQNTVTSFATIVTKKNHPSNFRVHLRYRTLAAGTYRSVGLSFDYQDKGNSQDVYTSVNDKNPSVQAFHRTGGKQVYPPAGIVRTPLKVGELIEMTVQVIGSKLTIHVNGQHKLDYPLPVPRHDGKFALWVHQGAAEFLDLKIEGLKDSRATLEARVAHAKSEVALASAKLEAAHAESDALRARVRADIARHIELANTEQVRRAAAEAVRAEQLFQLKQAQVQLVEARQSSNAEATERAQKAVDRASTACESPLPKSLSYSAVGAQHPQTSTGRRTALANWIASPRNVRTARVAANHLWSRHFGRPLVDTAENFGLNGRKPTHPRLLDWLASELIEHDWQMKPIHRQIVLSSTYRMSTETESRQTESRQTKLARSADGENRFFWRMNSRRMEAELVRDSTLYLAGRLNRQMGGPEIPENQGEQVARRSMYFRLTPNEKMQMLEIFDVADPNSCYRRKENVAPHQSLAMMNSGLVQDSARQLAKRLAHSESGPAAFVRAAFIATLCRPPSQQELTTCRQFLQSHAGMLQTSNAKQPPQRFPQGSGSKIRPSQDSLQRARENLVHVLLLHNDYVTIR